MNHLPESISFDAFVFFTLLTIIATLMIEAGRRFFLRRTIDILNDAVVATMRENYDLHQDRRHTFDLLIKKTRGIHLCEEQLHNAQYRITELTDDCASLQKGALADREAIRSYVERDEKLTRELSDTRQECANLAEDLLIAKADAALHSKLVRELLVKQAVGRDAALRRPRPAGRRK